ncbi:hypothetical protein [Priestia taiwanensis]|uniref:Uncharacterized protein n=1 Tax=Priestia taiwanensis TaxID=1347902 RepID=A0A917EKQ0_9BACI|nr:hypothetical protein [Priestia taiwanensis]MBM7361896.1 hypothetical protein [Priestia taiwanensis]GGE57812.1 hypothetical protein GCM10007140_05240 [Priestia taiwanensis]
MFDPTIFENLKVVTEGAVYDLDLDGIIQVTDRKDMIDMAHMGRHYEISFRVGDAPITATLQLRVDAKNWSDEVLEHQTESSCQIGVRFTGMVEQNVATYKEMQHMLQAKWGEGRTIKQRLSYAPCEENVAYEYIIDIHFNKGINEDHIDDLPVMIEYMVETIEELRKWM